MMEAVPFGQTCVNVHYDNRIIYFIKRKVRA